MANWEGWPPADTEEERERREFFSRHELEIYKAHAITEQEDEEAWAKEEIQPNTIAYSRRILKKLQIALDERSWAKVYQAFTMLTTDIVEMVLAMNAWREAQEGNEDAMGVQADAN